MMKFWYFINSPGVFFIETAEKRLEEWDADAYAARELEINRALLEKAVAAGRVGTVCSHDDFSRTCATSMRIGPPSVKRRWNTSLRCKRWAVVLFQGGQGRPAVNPEVRRMSVRNHEVGN